MGNSIELSGLLRADHLVDSKALLDSGREKAFVDSIVEGLVLLRIHKYLRSLLPTASRKQILASLCQAQDLF